MTRRMSRNRSRKKDQITRKLENEGGARGETGRRRDVGRFEVKGGAWEIFTDKKS